MKFAVPLDHAVPAGTDARAKATQGTVRDVMVRNPKTLSADASIDAARAALADDHVHMLLLTQGDTLRGTLLRTDLTDVPGSDPALEWSVLTGRTVAPNASIHAVQAHLRQNEMRRLAVTDVELRLLGLICFKRSRSGFCSNADIASRAAATTTDRRTSP